MSMGVITLAAKLVAVGDVLRTLPMDWPEPSLNTYPGGVPGLTWRVDGDMALNIVSVLGGVWTVYTYDEPKTIAYQDRGGVNVSIVVDGANLPDLAVQAVAS